MTRWIAQIGVPAMFGILLFGQAPANAQTLTVTGFVVEQECLSGDFVAVTLSATAESTSSPVGFRWDFTNNGTFDTRLRTNPTVTKIYRDEIAVTARVRARSPEGVAEDLVTFGTLRCE